MTPPAGSQAYVCLPCLLRSTRPARKRLVLEKQTSLTQSYTSSAHHAFRQGLGFKQEVQANTTTTVKVSPAALKAGEPLLLNPEQRGAIGHFVAVRKQVQELLGSEKGTLSFSALVDKIKDGMSPSEHGRLERMRVLYAEKTTSDALKDLEVLTKHRRPCTSKVEDDATIQLMSQLGILGDRTTGKKAAKAAAETEDASSKQTAQTKGSSKSSRRRARQAEAAKKAVTTSKQGSKTRIKIGKVSNTLIVRKIIPSDDTSLSKLPSASKAPARPRLRKMGDETLQKASNAPPEARMLDSAFIKQQAIETEERPKVPSLSFDLSRVLFNPGIYHLQDPRSRVYNFDPYLENIMPVTEFNFDALNPYITSSEDKFLRDVALKHGKRYSGSSSSMSGAMSQFHFLLSAWRPIDPSILSQRITGLKSFTQISRAPASIYLRWKDGVYGIDADKEYDTPNILMMQGKSMEKLLTLEKDDFEKYRKPKAGENAAVIDSDPEAYHYSSVENFLLRSQLDAHDPRLPGSGMFDLKTRAVAGIRMNMSEYEIGQNYQLKDRFGLWESFEREYYDMIRSAFLKYSLQVRMGRMDGIFVAYHNIQRIFGFQYISISELDMALHGQADTILGDREFRVTLKLMNDVFDDITREYPAQSVRVMFETRETGQSEPNAYMKIFAEPMTEEEIDKVQKSGKSKMDDYEKSMRDGVDPTKQPKPKGMTIEEMLKGRIVTPSTLESNAADTKFLDEVLGEQKEIEEAPVPIEIKEKPITEYKLQIFNEVNGKGVVRPVNITTYDQWKVKYTLERKTGPKTKGAYGMIRQRRESALTFDKEAKRNNFFQQKIRELSEGGRVWREEQDAADDLRNRVQLYAPAASTSS